MDLTSIQKYLPQYLSSESQRALYDELNAFPNTSKDWRGLMAPIHECGEEYQLVTAVPTNEEERNSWKDFVNLWLSDDL